MLEETRAQATQPKGNRTEVGERGIELSGGQHQNATGQFARSINRLKGRATILFITHPVPRGLQVDDVYRLRHAEGDADGIGERYCDWRREGMNATQEVASMLSPTEGRRWRDGGTSDFRVGTSDTGYEIASAAWEMDSMDNLNGI